MTFTAEAAREAARHRDGRFGEHAHSEPDVRLVAPFPTDPEARLATIAQWAREELDANGLHDWHFRFDSGTTRMGATDHSARTISLSRANARVNTEEESRDVLMHEIAHALVGRRHAHDAIWQAKAAQLGARPTATAPPATFHLQRSAAAAQRHEANRPSADLVVGASVLATLKSGREVEAQIVTVHETSCSIRIEGLPVTVTLPGSRLRLAPRT